METQNKKNLFCTVLTYPAPSSNYRGESEENRTVLQKINKDGKDYAIFSSESMRNALREILQKKGQPNNRTRLHNEGQLAVEFKELPDENKYADDFIFGYMVADKPPKKFDSVLRINYAVALSPYKYEATFHQSPLNQKTKNNEKKHWQNQGTSVLLHKEISHTAFQYPFALAGNDCAKQPAWIKALLDSIGELNNVAGGHARSYFEFAPRSLVARLTPKLVAGYHSYGFNPDGTWSEAGRINENDLPGNEFYLGGEVVRNLPKEEREKLEAAGVHLFDNPEKMIEKIKIDFLG
ncbi:MAG: type I-B CRISPR-associated protein Cas7/Cst2/DevR [Spirochaetia bacterium]|nr:type I-B CRISPR-associated protein Cas7/Cst2/DevR [Spirochaetia bacterium]